MHRQLWTFGEKHWAGSSYTFLTYLLCYLIQWTFFLASIWDVKFSILVLFQPKSFILLHHRLSFAKWEHLCTSAKKYLLKNTFKSFTSVMMLVSKDSLQIPSVVVTALLNLHSIVFIRDSELHGEQKSNLFIHTKLPRSQSRSCVSSSVSWSWWQTGSI